MNRYRQRCRQLKICEHQGSTEPNKQTKRDENITSNANFTNPKKVEYHITQCEFLIRKRCSSYNHWFIDLFPIREIIVGKRFACQIQIGAALGRLGKNLAVVPLNVYMNSDLKVDRVC